MGVVELLFVSEDCGNGVYTVSDNCSNTKERYTLQQMQEQVRNGIVIKGVSLKTDRVVVYPNFEAYRQKELARLKLIGCNLLIFSDDSSEVVGCLDADLKDVAIPDFISKIGDDSFKGCTSLKSVSIPNSVMEIGDNTFFKCALESVKIPKSVKVIGNESFRLCIDLRTLEISGSVEAIGNYAFMSCMQLKDIVLPDSVEKVGKGAFSLCYSLKTVKLSNSLTELSPYCFEKCIALSSIELPSSLTVIYDFAFDECLALSSVKLPDSVVNIGIGAFIRSALTAIELPSSVSTIGLGAFSYCIYLKSVTILNPDCKLDADVFKGSEDVVVHCQRGSEVAKYCDKYGIKVDYL